jgi:cytidine deaminase
MNLLQKLDKQLTRNVYINVARVKNSASELQVSLALPCLHCRKILLQFTKYRRRKYGTHVYIRYTQEDGTFSDWCTVKELPESKMSTGWRLKYKKKK